VSQLLRQLRSSGAVSEQALATATRRQQIYGGSLDTVLLELGLLEPPALAREIAAANQCDNAAVALMEPGFDRPWDALPKQLLELGWAMPLRRHLGHIQVVVHPEIPDEQREQLEQAIEYVQVFSTCEACLAKLAAERRGSVMPQRYAVLALTWKQALEREQAVEREQAPAAEPAAPAAPWMTAATTTAPYTVPPPDELAEARAPEPVTPKPETTGTRNPTFLYGLPVGDDDDDDDDESEATMPVVPVSKPAPSGLPVDDDDESEATIPLGSGVLSAAAAEAMPAPPPAPTGPKDEDAPTPRLVSRAAEPRPTASLAERLAGPRSVLERATERDQTTDALVRAAMVISPRVALFGLKKEGLKGLESPGEIPNMSAQLVELSPKIEAAVERGAVLDRVTDLDLRIAVGQEMAVPCLFVPIKVQDRPVLILYVDRNGDEFSSEEAEAANELCALAGRTLEEVLRRLRTEPAAASTPASAPKPAATPAAASTPPKSSLFSTPSSLLPPGGFGFKPPPTITPPPTIKPPPKPAIASPAAPATTPVVAPPPPPAEPPPEPVVVAPPPPPEPVVAPPPPTPPPAEPIIAPPVRVAPPPRPPEPVVVPPPPEPEPPPEFHAPLPSTDAPDKPPVRLKRVDPTAPAMPGEDAPRRGPTALSAPLGDSVRGRIVIDDEEEQPRTTSEANVEAIDSAIQAAMRGSSGAIQQLRDFGEAGYRRIVKQFPGELDVQRRDLDTLPPLPAHGALIRVALELPEFGPYLVELIDHPNPTVRFYVAFVFMELRHSRAIAALGDLAFDPDADVRAIAMRVLETYSGEAGFTEAVAVIRRELDSPNRTRQLHATRAVGTVRDIAAVSKLIDLLLSKERYIQEAALESLCSITGQQLGLKPHRWRSWYGDNAHHHRVEWIMSSLAHKDLSVRRWASDELRRITGQRINFLAAGTKQEREIGIRKWIEWWNERGRTEFGG
jgi:hypothetical protein